MSSATSPLTRSSSGRPALLRLVLLLPAGVALLAGLDAAAMLLDVPAPIRLDRLPDVHGVLMVLGFVGTLIALERAVALGHRLGYLAPGLLGLGGLFLISPAPIEIGQALLVAGAVALIGVYLPLWRRQRDEAVLVQIIGAAAGLGAAMLWLGGVAVPELLGWLASFVILTIAGERLELARLAMGPRAGTIMVALSHCLLAALVATLLWPEIGTVLLGLVVLGMTGWLAQHDIARATIRQSGFPRYAAGCMLAGYAWLAIAGGIWLLGGPVADGVRYDAVVHAVFLGFTFSMIMAHAPVILPAVLRRPLPYHPALIGPVVLLHGSLVLRLWAGDGLGSQDAWVTGGVLNILAALSFIAVAAWAATRPVPARETAADTTRGTGQVAE